VNRQASPREAESGERTRITRDKSTDDMYH
jgi:hypothetical protein